MIQLDSLILAFLVEAIAGLLLLVAVTWFFYYHNKKKDRSAAINLINELKKNEGARNQDLTNIMADAGACNQESFENLVTEVANCERTFYRHIVKMFLDRDSSMLAEVDKRVQALSEPYCAFITQIAENTDADPATAEAIETANSEIDRLTSDTRRLSEQLSITLETMNNVSSEYANMFGGTKEAEELERSRKKMLSFYKNAENRISHALHADLLVPSDENLVEEI